MRSGFLLTSKTSNKSQPQKRGGNYLANAGVVISGWGRFINALKEHYLADDKLPLLVRNTEPPALEKNTELRSLPLSYYFINLALNEHNESAKSRQEKNYQDIECLFQTGNQNQTNGWICITGSAGTGKTSFLQYVAYQWSQLSFLWNQRFHFVFRVKLNLIFTDSFKNSPRNTNFDDLVLLIHLSLGRSEKISSNNIHRCLETHSSQILLLLDGFDQIQSLYESNERVRSLADRAMQFPNGILTSRPNTLPESWHVGPEARFVKHYENRGFTEEHIKKYVKNYFENSPQSNKAEILYSALSLNSQMMSLARVPVNIAALCVTSNMTEEFEHAASVTTLYHNVWLWLFRRYIKIFCSTQEERDRGFNPSRLTMSEIQERCKSEYRFLTILAYEAFQKNEMQILSAALIAQYNPGQELMHKISQELDVLRPCGPSNLNGYAPYEFIHSTHQEYLTALYIAEKLSIEPFSDQEKEIERRKTIQKITQDIFNNRDNPRYELVLKFLAGLFSMSEYIKGVDYFLDAWVPEFTEINHFVGFHPHVKWAEKNQGIIREAIFTYYAYQPGSLSYTLPSRILTLKNILQSLLQLTAFLKNKEFLSEWDTVGTKNKISRSQRENYQLQQRQYHQELAIFELKKIDPLLTYFFILTSSEINIEKLNNKLLFFSTHFNPYNSYINIFSRVTPYNEGVIKLAQAIIIQPILYRLKDIILAAEIFLKLVFSKDITTLYYRDLRRQEPLEIVSLQQQSHTSGLLGSRIKETYQIEASNEGFVFGLLYDYLIRCSADDAIAIAYWMLKINPDNNTALQKLHTILNHDAFFNFSAAQALDWLEAVDSNTLNYIQTHLKSSDTAIRLATSNMLLKLDSNAEDPIKVLKKIMAGDDPFDRVNAASILIKHGINDPVAHQIIQTTLTDKNPPRRITAAETVFNNDGNVYHQDALVVVQDIAKTYPFYTFGTTALEDAIFLLGWIKATDNITLNIFRDRLLSPHIEIREKTAWALKHIAPILGIDNYEMIDVLFAFINTYNYEDQSDNTLNSLIDIKLALLRLHPKIYVTHPEFLQNPKIQLAFLTSLWMHSGCVYAESDGIIICKMSEADSFSLGSPEDQLTFTDQLRKLQIYFIQRFANSFLTVPLNNQDFLSSSEVKQVLTCLIEPIALPRMTNVFEADYLERDLPPPATESLTVVGVATGAQFTNSTVQVIQYINTHKGNTMQSSSHQSTFSSLNGSDHDHTSVIEFRYPYDGECAFMAKLVYLDKEEQKLAAPFTNKAKSDVLHAHHQQWQLAGWEFIPDLEFYHDPETGYVGSAYVNHRIKQVVIAHRGTKTSNWGALLEDYQSIFHNNVGQQMRSAFGYYRQIIAQFRGQGTHNALSPSTSLQGYQLSFTGHSLGGWLAELCALDAYLQLKLQIHTVTFDCPGSLPMMKKMLQDDVERIATIPKTLDITGFYGQPNLINVINPHVSTQIQIETNPISCSTLEEWFLYTARMHAMTDLLETFDIEQGCVQPNKAQKINAWPHHNVLAERTEEYTEFHQWLVVHKSSDIKTFRREFDKLYRANYRVEMYRPYEHSLRNMHSIVRDFFKGYLKVRDSLSRFIHDEKLREYLADYVIHLEANDEVISIDRSIGISAQTLIFQTTHYLFQYPEILEELLKAHNFDARLNQLSDNSQAEKEFPAIMTGIAAAVTNSTIDLSQIFGHLPERPRPEDYRFMANQLDKYPIKMRIIKGIDAPVYGSNIKLRQTFIKVGGSDHDTAPQNESLAEDKKFQQQPSINNQNNYSNVATINKMGAISTASRKEQKTEENNVGNYQKPAQTSENVRSNCHCAIM